MLDRKLCKKYTWNEPEHWEVHDYNDIKKDMVDDNYMEEDQRGKEGDEGLFADVTNARCWRSRCNGSVSIAIADSASTYVQPLPIG